MNLTKLKNICIKLGENCKPTYPVMAIAAVKGICRPAFTMMDKKEEPKTKKYTAIREGLTEIIAIPVYWACGEIAGSKMVTKHLPKDLQKTGSKNLMFLGVCAAALIVIPALCSAAIKPIMDNFYHNDKGLKKPQSSDTKPIYVPPANKINRPSISNFGNRPYSGMKVGGL